jgi:uncharacterized Zn finger protein
MTKPYTPTDATIRTWVGDQSFSRGQGYYRQHAITNPRRQGDTLKAHCFGSAPQPYRVEVTLGKNQILGDRCSCPIGGGCKHVAALLLTWSEEPESFTVVEELAAGLDRLSKAELIALVTKMVDRHPDLEPLLELSVLSTGAETQPLDPALVERQVGAVFRNIDYEYGSEIDVAEQLTDIKELGGDYAEKGEWHSAALVYKTVIEGVLENYEMFHDEGGELGEVVNECVSALEPCLANAQDPALRELILRTLFDTYRWDINYGGIDMGYEADDLILAFATPAEKRKVVEWVQTLMPAGDSWSDNYRRQSYGHFLLRLQEDELDDETFLRICRETGRSHDLVDRLLQLQCVEEAIAAAQASGDYDLLTMEAIFAEHEQEPIFARLMLERAHTSPDRRIHEWLKGWAQQRGDSATALQFAETLFWQQPSTASYRELKKLAQQSGSWATLQPQVMGKLAAEPRYRTVQIQVHLEEGEIDQALALLEAPQPSRWLGLDPSIQLEVARAAAKTRPHAAINIYLKHARRLIAQRNRTSYAEAAAQLAAVRDLYRQVGEEAHWRQLSADLRQEHRTLRALQDELNKAGL